MTQQKMQIAAAAIEPAKSKERTDHPYYNSGVLLLNLDGIRREKLDAKVLKAVNTHQYTFPDQDAINEIWADKMTSISPRYNWSMFTGMRPDEKPAIYHYAFHPKPWEYQHGMMPGANVWRQWSELWKTFQEKIK